MDAFAQHERARLKAVLDATSDFAIAGSRVTFAQHFETVCAKEPFCVMPNNLVESCRRLLDADVCDTIPTIVRQHVFVTIGCNTFPLFALESGGVGRTLFRFHCVYANCSSFLDVRLFASGDRIKWVVVCLSHSHSFDTFPQRLPRNTFQQDARERLERMAGEKRTCAAMKIECNALCSNDVFQNAVRSARARANADQSRALRNAVASSDVWASEVHVDASNVFVEAFFANAALVAKRVSVNFVFVDDTACTNAFMFPLVAVLCRDVSKATHAVAWAIVRNRTTSTFERFFTFVAKFFPAITTFMCDRHFAQKNAIVNVFGGGVHVLHCCVHIARNIKSNTGRGGGLASDFWAMRFKRTTEAEATFLAGLRRMDRLKKSAFTKHMLDATDSYIPSIVDPVLLPFLEPLFIFPSGVVLSDIPLATEQKKRAWRIVGMMRLIDQTPESVFSIDNTNTVESYFSVIKGRINKTTSTLADVYKSVNFTELSVLAARNPASPTLPDTVVDVLLTVVTRDVVNVLSTDGVRGLLNVLCLVSLNALLDKQNGDDCASGVVMEALQNGTRIDTFRWMPHEWVLSVESPHPTHDVFVVDTAEGNDDTDVAMRLEPFFGISNRSLPVFQLLSDTLLTLSSIVPDTKRMDDIHATFSFFKKEYERFINISANEPEVAVILSELCVSLEALSQPSQQQPAETTVRKSIVDPCILRMKGPKTTTTSARVNHTAPCPRTAMVEKVHGAVREKAKPSHGRKKQHTCPICRGEGHHARTCRDVLVEENRARAELFFIQLIETRQLDKYLVCMARRVSPQFAREIEQVIKTSSATKGLHDGTQTPRHERTEAQDEGI